MSSVLNFHICSPHQTQAAQVQRSGLREKYRPRFLHLEAVSLTFRTSPEFRDKVDYIWVFIFRSEMLIRGNGQFRRSRDKFTWMLTGATPLTLMNSNLIMPDVDLAQESNRNSKIYYLRKKKKRYSLMSWCYHLVLIKERSL